MHHQTQIEAFHRFLLLTTTSRSHTWDLGIRLRDNPQGHSLTCAATLRSSGCTPTRPLSRSSERTERSVVVGSACRGAGGEAQGATGRGAGVEADLW